MTTVFCVLMFNSCDGKDKDTSGGGGNEGGTDGEKTASFSFVPNQCAGNSWYRPGNPPSLINGHLDESFGDKSRWANLMESMKKDGGAFSIFAAEIGHMSNNSGLIPTLREAGIPISVEMPGFTQAIPGTALGEAELNGRAYNGNNIFASIFQIRNPTDRPDPDGKGWFVTKDREPFIPDEILFDERQPNLCPQFDANKLASTQGTWEERMRAALIPSPHPQSTGDFATLLSIFRRDYVDFLNVAKDKWGDKMPAVSIHWNVVAGWEWRDQKGINDIHAKDPNYFNIADNFYAIVRNCPQYNSVIYLEELIDVLTAAGFKPKTVLMDVDWTYDIPYITETLNKHKKSLKAKGVQMGINIVEASINDNEELYYDGTTLRRRARIGANPNELYENTLIGICQFLKGSGIYEKGMQMRVGSWSHRPYETKAQIDENTTGSIAHTANEIIKMFK